MIFNFPDVGEGIHEGVIVNWLKNVGDSIKTDEPLVEVETDKAVVEIPSPVTGVLTKQYYKVGETAIVDQPLCEFTVTEDQDSSVQPTTTEPTTSAQTDNKTEEPKDSGNVVGSLEDADSTPNKFDTLDFSQYDPKAAQKQSTETVPTQSQSSESSTPKALPKVRKLAETLGVDLSTITPTGANNTITEEDVQKASTDISSSKESIQTPQTLSTPQSSPTPNLIAPPTNLSTPQYGEETIEPLTPTRKAIARNMMQSVMTTAQVTHFDEINIENLIQKRAANKEEAETYGVKLTYLPFIIQAMVRLNHEFPKFNAAYDTINHQLIYKKFTNIGIAVDTDYGLVVPVLKNTEKYNLFELARQIIDLAELARAKKLSLEQMKDSTITITNYGSIGGQFATPILNPPNLISLGIGRFNQKLVFDDDGKVVSNTFLPVSLTYDHQIIDGADAAKYIKRLAELLNAPAC